MSKSFVEKLEEVKSTVVTSVVDQGTVDEVNKVIEDQKALFAKCVAELKRRGKASVDAINKFAVKCWDKIKELLGKLIGHIKDLWSRIVGMFKDSNEVKA